MRCSVDNLADRWQWHLNLGAIVTSCHGMPGSISMSLCVVPLSLSPYNFLLPISSSPPPIWLIARIIFNFRDGLSLICPLLSGCRIGGIQIPLMPVHYTLCVMWDVWFLVYDLITPLQCRDADRWRPVVLLLPPVCHRDIIASHLSQRRQNTTIYWATRHGGLRTVY